MKKRIALVAAIATAIAVGGMVPASAKLGAPAVSATSCARAAGTLEIKAKNGNIKISLEKSKIKVEGTPDCSSVDLSLSGLSTVVLKATSDDAVKGNIYFDLESSTAGTPANFTGITMSVQAEGTIEFDASGLTEAGTEFKPVLGTVTEDSFTVGTATGTYYAGLLKFKGGKAGDTFDASAVTSTAVNADGGDGDDTLSGGALNDTLAGGDGSADGDDVLYGNAGNDTLVAYDGTAVCSKAHPVFPGEKCSGVVLASTGADQAWGGLGNDSITSDGGDTVAPGDGADVVTGNAYQLRYSDSSTAVTVNLTTTAKKVLSTAGNDYFSGSVVEFVGSALADTFVGTVGGGEVFYGLAGADSLFGLGSDDFLSGNSGNDVIKGGSGDDEIYGEVGNDQISAGLGNDTVYGGSGDDVMFGGPGNDALRGMEGKDQAWGGRGAGDLCAGEVTDSCEFKK